MLLRIRGVLFQGKIYGCSLQVWLRTRVNLLHSFLASSAMLQSCRVRAILDVPFLVLVAAQGNQEYHILSTKRSCRVRFGSSNSSIRAMFDLGRAQGNQECLRRRIADSELTLHACSYFDIRHVWSCRVTDDPLSPTKVHGLLSKSTSAISSCQSWQVRIPKTTSCMASKVSKIQ